MDSGIEGIKFDAFVYMMKPIEMEPLLENLKEAYDKKENTSRSPEMLR